MVFSAEDKILIKELRDKGAWCKETHYRISNEKFVPSWCQQAVKNDCHNRISGKETTRSGITNANQYQCCRRTGAE